MQDIDVKEKENQKELLFSIILPVYNVEKYISKCLDSVINQTYSNLEIICVNDGSTDNSRQIIEGYALKDNRIIIIDQPNQGQGVARNNGINHASGDYVSFIDPDDWVEPNIFKKLSDYIILHRPKVLQFGVDVYFEETGEISKDFIQKRFEKSMGINLSQRNFYSLKDIKKENLLKFTSCCWNKVYKTSFIRENNLKFPPHKMGEDTMFTFSVLFRTDKIDLIQDHLYIYRLRSNSSVSSDKKRNTLYIFEQIDWLKRLLEEKNLMSHMKKEFIQYKIRAIYEGDKKCLSEKKKEFLHKAKSYLTPIQYLKFVTQKIVSKVLRNIFLYKKNVYIDNIMYSLIVLFGFKIKIRCNGVKG